MHGGKEISLSYRISMNICVDTSPYRRQTLIPASTYHPCRVN